MQQLHRWTLALVCGLVAAFGPAAALADNPSFGDTAPWASQLTYEPVSLGWTAQEVDRVTRANAAAILQRARAAGASDCTGTCPRAQTIFARLLVVARQQSAHAAALPWELVVVQMPDIEAMAMPGGLLIVGQPFLDRATDNDEELAFVLAHEMAHSILEHERQALSYARLLLPRQVRRSVRDMYTEMDFNFSLLKALEPVMQQGEFEADELGLLLAAASGYAPRAQARYIEREALATPKRPPLVATHPAALDRLARLHGLLPWADRVHRARPATP